MNPQAQQAQHSEDEIDLRAYVQVLVRYWWFIGGATVIAAVVAVVIGLSVTPIYEATATMVITPSKAQLSLEPRFTIIEEGLADDKGAADAQRAALAGLVSNATIASEVIASLEDGLPPELHDLGRLMSMVDGQVVYGDLIQITVQSSSPVTASLVANAWGAEYEKYVNQLYAGRGTESAPAIAEQAGEAKADYEVAEQALVEFTGENRVAELTRLIEEKQEILKSLWAAKQKAIARIIGETVQARQEIISAYLDAQTENRLLAFNKEQEAKRAYISALMDAEAAARLTAVQKDREGRAKIFAQYVDAEIVNRLAALEQEQMAKTEIFAAYAAADASAKSAAVEKQLDAEIETLASHYQTRLKLERLLQDAKGLYVQVSQGGVTGSATNGLAILLLKAQAFASSEDLPGGFELRLDDISDFDVGTEVQLADLGALIAVLEKRIEELDTAIDSQSKELTSNQWYDLLLAGPSRDDPLLATLAQKYAELFEVGDLAEGAETVWQDSELAQAIQAKYDELFGAGKLVEWSSAISPTTPILAVIKAQYPELFSIGDLSGLIWEVPADNPLALIGAQLAEELLQLSDLGSLPGSAAASQELDQPLASLEEQVRTLQAQSEAEQARERELKRARDLAWETYTTVARKVAEVDVTTSVASTLVRFASPAVEPAAPVPSKSLQNVVLAAVAGFVAASGLVLFLHFLNPDFDPKEVLRQLRRGEAS